MTIERIALRPCRTARASTHPVTAERVQHGAGERYHPLVHHRAPLRSNVRIRPNIRSNLMRRSKVMLALERDAMASAKAPSTRCPGTGYTVSNRRCRSTAALQSRSLRRQGAAEHRAAKMAHRSFDSSFSVTRPGARRGRTSAHEARAAARKSIAGGEFVD
jgi:hypothetical protein